MKKIYSLLLLATALISMTAVSCSQDDVEGSEVSNAGVSASLSAQGVVGFESTSATFDLETTNIESFAYKLHEGEFDGVTDGLVIYADAAEIFDVESEGTTYTIYGLEGGEQYTVEFSFKVEGASKYLVESVTFTTDEYDDKYIHMISADRTSLEFVINMPEGVKYRYSLVDRSTYELSRMDYAWDDMTFLRYGVMADGYKKVSLNNGDIIGQDADGLNLTQTIAPGMAFVLMVVECDDSYTPLYEQVSYSSSSAQTRVEKPNLGDYTEECSDSNISPTGIYAKQYFTTTDPLPADGEVVVDIKTTERSASITFTPSEEVVRYGYSIWTDSEIEVVESLVGEDGLITAMQSEFTPETEAAVLEFDIEMGESYQLVMIHISDEDELTRTTTIIPFTATESTNPVVLLEVTPAECALTSSGEPNPYSVAFNIKAPNKDCDHIMMAVDYTRNFIPEANGLTGTRDENIEELVLTYGYEVYASESGAADIFAAINSDAGYLVEFDSFEDTENLLAVLSFNADEKTYLSYCTSRSAVEPAKDLVTSEEFEKIVGEWTANYKYNASWDDTSTTLREANYKVTITSDPAFDAPEVFDESDPNYSDIYDYYVSRGTLLGESDPYSYAANQIQIDFEDFNEIAQHFKEKYEAQNRKIMFGCVLDEDTGISNHSAWELFCDLDYSIYDVEQLFYDYGPKIFIEAKAESNGSVVMEMVSDSSIVSPFFSYYGSVHSAAGMSLTAWSSYGYTEFTSIYSDTMTLQVSDDDNISLNSITDAYGNRDYYLSTSYNLMDMDWPLTYGRDNLSMSRGYDEVSAASMAPVSYLASRSGAAAAPAPYRIGNKFKRMYMPNSAK